MAIQRILWWIGRWFCEVDERIMVADIATLKAHVADCDRRHADLERRLDQVNQDRMELLQQITNHDEPPLLHLMKEDA